MTVTEDLAGSYERGQASVGKAPPLRPKVSVRVPSVSWAELYALLRRGAAIVGLAISGNAIAIKDMSQAEHAALAVISGAIFIIDHFKKKGTTVASQQTLTDLTTAVTALGTAVTTVEDALTAAAGDDAAIEAQVTAINAATASLTSAAGTTPAPPAPPAA